MLGPRCLIARQANSIAEATACHQRINQPYLKVVIQSLIDKQFRQVHTNLQSGHFSSTSLGTVCSDSSRPALNLNQSNKLWKKQRVVNLRRLCHLCMRKRQMPAMKYLRNFSNKPIDFINPIDRLQAFVDVPILPTENHLFKPSPQEMQTARQFWSQNMKEMKFLTSVKFQEQLPQDNLPEVTFIGRSNVGKSSLIQAMFQESDVVVKTSKTPGHTRLLNFFEVKNHFRLVDVPGYGYRMPEDYPQMVETFLKTRTRLVRTYLIIDGNSKLNQTDMIGINMVEEFQIPYVFVITKIDKVQTSVLLRNLLEIQKVMKRAKFCFPQPFLVSGLTGEGIPLLQTFTTYVTGNMAIEGM